MFSVLLLLCLLLLLLGMACLLALPRWHWRVRPGW
jgi:hypothetical protein